MVMTLLPFLDQHNVPVILRTVVANPTYKEIPKMAHLLKNISALKRWSLQEFSPIGDGYLNREQFELDREMFDVVVHEAERSFSRAGLVDAYRAEAKIGAYALITPDGFVYGTTSSVVNGIYPQVGSILQDHLSDIAQELPFSKEGHESRYKQMI